MKKSKFFVWGIVAVVIVVLAVVGLYVIPKVKVNIERPYTAVYMENGDVYFGRLSYFPRTTISNVYTIQRVADPKDPSKTSLQVVPLSVSVWGPDKLVLNRDKIILLGRVGEDSQVMRIIKQAESGQQQQPTGQQQPVQQPTDTSAPAAQQPAGGN